jgi:SAM-dependent methyltransferase
MIGSLAYRKNEEAILRGDVPEKYTRLLPYIPGKRILELGSAEGVLALLLAKAGKEVTALEKSHERHEAAIRLREAWGMDVNGPRFMCGSIAQHPELLVAGGFDTLVAVRMIYYLGDALDSVFRLASTNIPNVVLCGNRNRAARWHAGTPDEPLGEMNKYASAVGMAEVLERNGYEVTETVLEGDPIVVGRSRAHPAQNLAA